MTREKAEASAKPAVASKSSAPADHEYAVETSTPSVKRETPPTPTKAPTPPSTGTVSQSVESNNSIIEAKLTNKIDDFGVQLSNNMITVANIAKLAAMNAADIKVGKAKLSGLELENPGWKEKNDEDTREEVIDILAKVAPRWASALGNTVDAVHRLGKKEAGRHRQIIVQFTMRRYREAFWKLRIPRCARSRRLLQARFLQTRPETGREARAAVWPKMGPKWAKHSVWIHKRPLNP